MNSRLIYWIMLVLFAGAVAASAHAPFDCSARVFVHADSAEVIVVAGSGLAEKFLQPAAVNLRNMSGVGRPVPLPLTLADGFFNVVVAGKKLSPKSVKLVGDGTEFQFCVVYPLPPSPALRLEAKFLPALSAPRTVPLVVCDENNNILGTAILVPERAAADFALPATLFPASAQTNVPSPAVARAEAPPPAPVAVAVAVRPGFTEFLRLGIGHILTGFDHLLFLGALLLGCRRLKPMLLVITGFTLAHSLTLALAALELVTLSSRVVEPLIAVSIVIVAAENLRRAGRNEDGRLKMEHGGNVPRHPPFSILNLRSPDTHRYALTCGFGLIHGFGFAGALRATGLAANGAELAAPLFAFNLGVEAGQLAVAAVFLPVLFGLRRWPGFERLGNRVISVAVMLVAAYWVWVRLTISGD